MNKELIALLKRLPKKDAKILREWLAFVADFIESGLSDLDAVINIFDKKHKW